jgi:3-phosphoshikimate 1-carboxyvinyltransferase
MLYRVEPGNIRARKVSVPGDKSISHRALMLGSIAEGNSRITGFLNGDDCLATLAAMREMGVTIDEDDATTVVVEGVGMNGLKAPASQLDMGNSGTAMRLMSGLLAGQRFTADLTGDSSLSGRPMGRIIKPLQQMGARIDSRDGHPPLVVRGTGQLESIDYDMPVASAQVKSAILLAGLYASGETRVTEPAVTRDHTERMLSAMGAIVTSANGRIMLRGGQTLRGCDIEVPGDLSSAAFLILAALLSEDADLCIQSVGVNPTRTGIIDILMQMDADITVTNQRSFAKEPVADIRVRSSRLRGCAIDPALVSLAIDEFPVLFVAAGAASGKTTFSGIGELRVKESDRIKAMAAGLAALDIRVEESADGAVVHGGAFSGGEVDSFGDHRIAMALAAAACASAGPVIVRNVAAVDTSFPGFAALMTSAGLRVEVVAE